MFDLEARSQTNSLFTPKITQSQSPIKRPESPRHNEISQELDKIHQRFVESIERTNKFGEDKVYRSQQK